ncbi:hypothetical protein [Streptomyces benahoarensis]|nr:hypothetical protein [Streptomyces benahoarensis]
MSLRQYLHGVALTVHVIYRTALGRPTADLDAELNRIRNQH